MRIVHVVPSYLPAVRHGGPIFAIHGLCRALAARGHQVEVFTTNVDGPNTVQSHWVLELSSTAYRFGTSRRTSYAASIGPHRSRERSARASQIAA